MHHYPHHIGDYRTHTAHLTMVEDGAYRRLLDIYYMNEFALPPDIATVQRLVAARSKEERAAVATILHEFFLLETDGWHQRRADEEIAAYQARADNARKNGKGGGRPKTRDKPKHKPTHNQPGYFSETQTQPGEKLTVNRKPETNNREPEEEVEGAIAPAPPTAEAVALFNEAAEQVGWPKVQVLSSGRKRALTACLHAIGSIEGWQTMLAKATASDFLSGRSRRSEDHANWRMDFDFFVKKHVKIMEGGYDNSPNSQRQPIPERGIGAVLAALAD
jgi:uncharacterized protein YdaU (DUF1376 family)